MSYEIENHQLDSDIRKLEIQIELLKRQDNCAPSELASLESQLQRLKERRNKSKVVRMLGDAEMHKVSGRVWSMNDGCLLWMFIFWAICFLLSLPFILSH